MSAPNETFNESAFRLASLVACTALSLAVIATIRIELAILLVGLLSFINFTSGKTFWIAWSIAFATISFATILVAFGSHAMLAASLPLSDGLTESISGSPASGAFRFDFTAPWLSAMIVLSMLAVYRWKQVQRPRGTETSERNGHSNTQSHLTSELNDELVALCGTDLRSDDSLELNFESDVNSRSTYRLGAHDIEEVLRFVRREGDFDDVQLRVIDDALRHTEFQHGGDLADLLSSGSRVGNYIIEKLLNQGGGGRIYVARHVDNSQIVALKVLKSRKLSSRFRREMSLVEKLAHPNIVVAYEVDDHEGVPFIAMELLSGVDLHAHVRSEGPVTYETSLNWILQAARALAHADERGLTHRDVKPGNLILHRDNVLKLTDLGLAVLRSTQSEALSDFITRDAAVVGTLEFMAPEQAKSLASADARSDIFGLGATWFYLLEGKAHLPGKSLKEQLSALLVDRKFHKISAGVLPPRAHDVLMRMLAFDPDDRFQTWDEVINALISLSDDSHAKHSPTIQVLLIEDNADDVVLTTRLLSKMNQSVLVHEATTMAEAEECLNGSVPYNLILLDLQLPDSTGLETVHAVRRCDPTTPIVVLSGYSDESIGQACIEAGANAFASKNALNVHELERAIFVTHSRHESFVADDHQALTAH